MSSARAGRRLARRSGCRPTDLVRLSQVHGSAVHVATDTPLRHSLKRTSSCPTSPDRVVAVQVADCAPILTADRSGRFVAASHAGWRGTAADVAGVTVAMPSRAVSARRLTRLTAAIGPCIGPCCYEVGEELVGAFGAHGLERRRLRSMVHSPRRHAVPRHLARQRRPARAGRRARQRRFTSAGCAPRATPIGSTRIARDGAGHAGRLGRVHPVWADDRPPLDHGLGSPPLPRAAARLARR